MESKKFNWNKILNTMIAGIGLILAFLFFGMCFIVPNNNTKANALTKSDIKDLGIYFNSAKTKIRTANSLDRTRLFDDNDVPFEKYTYGYIFDSVKDTDLYYVVDEINNSQYGKVSIASDNGTKLNTLDKYTGDRNNDFIPYGVDYFYCNDTNNLQSIFYDEADDKDFVLLDNNYNINMTKGNTFNVENFYLSFGNQYLGSKSDTTLLYNFKVYGTLTNTTGKYNLVLNEVDNTQLPNGQHAQSWYQYFDLNKMSCFNTQDNTTSEIPDLQGKYEITFYDIGIYEYNEEKQEYEVPKNEVFQTFTYTFYLLDSANYDNIPSVNNAKLGSMKKNEINEYFYNFTNDYPYLNYNPNAFNISYFRENKDIKENITTTYINTIYSKDGRNYPYNIINFNNDCYLKKQVLILTYYNDQKSLVEYLYLANYGSPANYTYYENIINDIKTGKLEFEYKVSKELVVTEESNTTTYTTNTYTTYDFDKLEFSDSSNPNNWTESSKSSSIYILQTGTNADNKIVNYYYKDSIEDSNLIATITEGTKPLELNETQVESLYSDAIIIDKFKLTSDSELNTQTTSYKLRKDNGKIFVDKKYMNGEVSERSFELNLSIGNNEIIDPIDKHIVIKYVVSIVEGNAQIISMTFISYNYETNYLHGDKKSLDYILHIDSLSINEISYNLEFNDLGVYEFDYKYSLIINATNSTDQRPNQFVTIVNDTTSSTNSLPINNFSIKKNNGETKTETSTTPDLKLCVSGYFGSNSKVTLGGYEYELIRSTEGENKISLYVKKINESTPRYTITGFKSSLDNKTYSVEDNNTIVFGTGSLNVPTDYIVSSDLKGLYLEVRYSVGSLTTTVDTKNYDSSLQSNSGYIKDIKTITSNTYNLDNTNNDIDQTNSDAWSSIIKLLEIMGNSNINSCNSVIESQMTESPNISHDILHIFGSITYFNKKDSTTDSGYAKLQYKNNRTKENYISDITKFITSSGALFNTAPNIDNIINNSQTDLNANDIIITDMTPVLWKNYSSLLYDGKISKSKIYRYPNYTVANDGTITCGESIISTYTKDTYCQFDGLYKIVVIYQYDGFKSLDTVYNYDNTIFYQVFTFIIDNSSPKLNIKVQGEDENYSELLGLNTYTNKNIELSWEVPSYFRNNVYIEIENTLYSSSDYSQAYTAEYKNNQVNVLKGNSAYINSVTNTAIITDVVTNKKYYAVYITSENTDCNGNYKVTLHYSTNGNSTVTEKFIIDKQNISGMRTLPIIQNDNGTYSLNKTLTTNSQIIKNNFTFRYNPKDSKANIYTYWYKIDLEKANSSEYDQIISTNDHKSAVTTTYKINAKNLANLNIGNQYLYDYNTSDNVPNKYCFVNTTSALYLFRLVDDAGNECRYVVFYDNTTPRFVMTPDIDNNFHIVNDATKVTWGNYKAILIDTDNSYEIQLGTKVDNYTKLESDTFDALQESLMYLNHMNTFNDSKIQSIDGKYYILSPIDYVNVIDLNGLTYNNTTNNVSFDSSTNLGEFYFFPHNPVNDAGNKITLPIDFNNPKVTADYDISSASYKQILNSDYELVNRFLSTTGDTTLHGGIGETEYDFRISDRQGNTIGGYLWMNLDKTRVAGVGIFDKTSEDLSKASPLTGNEGSYSASKFYITSLAPKDDDSIPDYDLTYKFYELNYELYQTLNSDEYTLETINLYNATTDSSLKDEETKMVMTFFKLNDDGQKEYKTISIELTDEDGNVSPKHSYPYDLNGLAVVSDSSGNPEHIYKKNTNSYQVVDGDNTTLYSTIINPTADINGAGNIITQEGLYIFKRAYKSKTIDLGDDSRIIYRIYYIDRNNIINISTLNSLSETLSNAEKAQTFGYTLGKNYTEENLKKYITAQNIKNNSQVSNNKLSQYKNYGYSSDSAEGLFTTNKVQVAFNTTADKYNFNAFTNAFNNKLFNKIDSLLGNASITNEDSATLRKGLTNHLFNETYYSKFYKLDLTISKGQNLKIIDETNININERYNQTAIDKYLKNYTISNPRHNEFNFYLEDANSNSYYIKLIDKSGYRLFDGNTVANDNFLANDLLMTFKISQSAPIGDAYGKYYGSVDYDEGKSSNHSIPFEDDGTYALLSTYLATGKLDSLSLNYKSGYPTQSRDGQYIKLYSTNNESLIFTFSITQDEYMAQIDPNNIQIYKGSISDSNLIFNRVNGYNHATSTVSESRMTSSFIRNIIDGVEYYGIIVFDNNLDQILDSNEKSYSNYRLLDASQNSDNETYYIKLHYVGDEKNYIKQDDLGNDNSYATTTFEIKIDRNKPVYNLTKLMELDKYVYNPISNKVTTSNYENIFNLYKQYYGYGMPSDDDKLYEFERSYLENYFFSIDYREKTSFAFESVSDYDSYGGIYIRSVDRNSYKFSITPDDYKAYYEATYLPGHPQFTPSRAITLNTPDILDGSKLPINTGTFYYIPYGISESEHQDNKIYMSYLVETGVLTPDTYYEIIERDEAGNYRVYGIYIPDYKCTTLSYNYKPNSTSNEIKSTILYGQNSNITVSGIDFNFLTFNTKDPYMKAILKINSQKLTETISIIFEPNEECIYVKNSQNNNIDKITNVQLIYNNTGNVSTNGYINSVTINKFLDTINYYIKYYNDLLSSKDSAYYTEFGYVMNMNIIDRIGISTAITGDRLYDYEFTYNVAGSVLSPMFANSANSFTVTIPALTGTTYIKEISVYKFEGTWGDPLEHDAKANSFRKNPNELKNGFTYTLGKGVYKFILKDNFERVETYFYEYGSNNTQVGGTLKFIPNTYQTYSDGYTYTSQNAEFSYDNSLYDIFIRFQGTTLDDLEITENTDITNSMIYSSKGKYTNADLMQYGITIASLDNITTITFGGVRELSKYHIKIVPASLSAQFNYTWDLENSNHENASKVMVYDKKLAIYTAIPKVVIKNLNGNILETKEGEILNLTEDFEVTLQWPRNITTQNQIDFNNKIVLARTYTQNNVVMPTEILNNSNSYIITKTGQYVAYVINDLNSRSDAVTFTRGEGNITLYSLMSVNKSTLTESKLSPSTIVSSETYVEEATGETRKVIMFNYFTTRDYFSFKDTTTNTPILIDNIDVNMDISNIAVNRTASQYLEVRVNSNLSIQSELYSLGIEEGIPFAEFKIFSRNSSGEEYTFRFVKVYFLDKHNYSLAKLSVTNIITNVDTDNLYTGANAVIKRSDTTLYINFENEISNNLSLGNIIYIDRYFNDKLIETITITKPEDFIKTNKYLFKLSQVGVYKLVVRDLAGRTQKFGNADNNTLSNTLTIYLINQVIFTVNDSEPINNQIFNGSVKIEIVSTLNDLKLYNTNNIGITVTKNGISTSANSGSLEFSDAGYYSIQLVATTIISDENFNSVVQEIYTTYNFTIVKTNVALRSFNVSKGTGFVIDKILKIVNGEQEEITDKYESTDSLIWLTYEQHGNSIFEITLKDYNENIKDYRYFTFNIWINNDAPVIISTIPEGTSTKNTITLSFNPGIIYTQVGRCKILVNDKLYMDIDENSERNVNEIKISQKGSYTIKLISEDGTLISSYKFTKNDPLNQTTKIILICLAVGAVILVAIFFLLRRKGKYR